MAIKNENQKIDRLLTAVDRLVTALSELKVEAVSVPPANTHKQRKSEGLSEVKMDYSVSPVTRPIRSSAQCLEDIYFQQGAMDRETWEQIKGIEYDSYGDIDDDNLASREDSDDEFEQSAFASYHDFKKTKFEPASEVLEVPNVENSSVDVATARVAQEENTSKAHSAPSSEQGSKES